MTIPELRATAFVISLLLLAVMNSAAVAETARPCMDSLTFRWTSGEPIRLDIEFPGDGSLANPPFLRDPRIVSAELGQSWMGPNVTIKVDRASAEILGKETAAHADEQMLVMIGRRVITAAMVRKPLGNVFVISGRSSEQLDQILKLMQVRSGTGNHRSPSCE